MDYERFRNYKQIEEAEAELQAIAPDLAITAIEMSDFRVAGAVKCSFPMKGRKDEILKLRAAGWIMKRRVHQNGCAIDTYVKRLEE